MSSLLHKYERSLTSSFAKQNTCLYLVPQAWHTVLLSQRINKCYNFYFQLQQLKCVQRSRTDASASKKLSTHSLHDIIICTPRVTIKLLVYSNTDKKLGKMGKQCSNFFSSDGVGHAVNVIQ